jgi:hypothetical protein
VALDQVDSVVGDLQREVSELSLRGSPDPDRLAEARQELHDLQAAGNGERLVTARSVALAAALLATVDLTRTVLEQVTNEIERVAGASRESRWLPMHEAERVHRLRGRARALRECLDRLQDLSPQPNQSGRNVLSEEEPS